MEEQISTTFLEISEIQEKQKSFNALKPTTFSLNSLIRLSYE